MDAREIAIFQKLVADENQLIRELELIVEEIKSFLTIEMSTGRIILRNYRSLSHKEKILLLLFGKYAAHKVKLTPTASPKLSEIAEELCIPATSLSGPIRQLIRDGFVEKVGKSEYRIQRHSIKEALSAIVAKEKK